MKSISTTSELQIGSQHNIQKLDMSRLDVAQYRTQHCLYSILYRVHSSGLTLRSVVKLKLQSQMNMPLKSSRPKELGPSRYWSKGCGYSTSKECNKS